METKAGWGREGEEDDDKKKRREEKENGKEESGEEEGEVLVGVGKLYAGTRGGIT